MCKPLSPEWQVKWNKDIRISGPRARMHVYIYATHPIVHQSITPTCWLLIKLKISIMIILKNTVILIEPKIIWFFMLPLHLLFSILNFWTVPIWSPPLRGAATSYINSYCSTLILQEYINDHAVMVHNIYQICEH